MHYDIGSCRTDVECEREIKTRISSLVLQIKTLNSSSLSLFALFLPILPRPPPFLYSPNSNNRTTNLTPMTSPPHVPLPDSDDQIPTTSTLTFASTSWCNSSNATAHRSKEVDASCTAKRKSKRQPLISASVENSSNVSPKMDYGRRSGTESWSTQAWGRKMAHDALIIDSPSSTFVCCQDSLTLCTI